MLAMPWQPGNGAPSSTIINPAQPRPAPLTDGQLYMYAAPPGQFQKATPSGPATDARSGKQTTRPDPAMADVMAHPSPKGRMKVTNRWETEYSFQYVAAVPRPRTIGMYSSEQVAKQMGGMVGDSVPAAPAAAAVEAVPASAPDPVMQAEMIANAAAEAADRATAAAEEAAIAAHNMRRRASNEEGPPATSLNRAEGNPEAQPEYDSSTYAPSPVQAADVGDQYMVPAAHVCKNNTVHSNKAPNPQHFGQSNCLKCKAEPQADPVLFMPFEPRTLVEQNPKFYKYMPKELLQHVPPAGKPLNRDYPAACCFDVFD